MSSSKKSNELNFEIKFSLRSGAISKMLHAFEMLLVLAGIILHLIALIH